MEGQGEQRQLHWHLCAGGRLRSTVVVPLCQMQILYRQAVNISQYVALLLQERQEGQMQG